MELSSLESVISVILIIVTCNCLPFSYSRSIFRTHLSWQVLKIAFRSLQIWEFSGGGDAPDLPTRLVPSVLAIMAPCCKKPSYGPESGFDLTNLFLKILTSTIYRLWSLLHCFLYQTSLGPNRPRLMHVSDLNTVQLVARKLKKKLVLRKYDWVKFPEDNGKGTAAEGNTLDTVKFRK